MLRILFDFEILYLINKFTYLHKYTVFSVKAQLLLIIDCTGFIDLLIYIRFMVRTIFENV
jgi:hypothetical protein